MIASESELQRLMVAGLNGDAQAYRLLLDRLSQHLRAYYKTRLARVGRGPSEAEDLVQEVLIAIHTRRHAYDEAEPFTPWVHAIARYKFIDFLRKTKQSLNDVQYEDSSTVLTEADRVESDATRDLNSLLLQLPEKMRRSIRLVKLEGFSVVEAAAQTGMSVPAIKVSIHRGMKLLSSLIGKSRSP